MAHRVHPKIFRIKKMKDWDTRGFYGKDAPKYLEEDFRIREFLEKKLKIAGVASIEIERFPEKLNIIILTSRPGLIIGRGGEGVARLEKEVQKLLVKPKEIKLEIQTVKIPWTSAALVGQWIAQRIEKRMPYKRVIKQALEKIMSVQEIMGTKIQISGRLDGTEMARTEWQRQGKLPRQTLRGDIDYAHTEAYCTYGVIGIKVWIYKGEK